MEDLKTREAAAIAAALLLARLAQLRFERDPAAPVLPFGNHLYARAARLLVVPTTTDDERNLVGIGAAMTLLGSDALVVRATGRRADAVRFQVGRYRPCPFWHAPMRLWLSAGAPVCLATRYPRGKVFTIDHAGVRGYTPPPWADDDAEREAGFARGADALAAVL